MTIILVSYTAPPGCSHKIEAGSDETLEYLPLVLATGGRKPGYTNRLASLMETM